MTHAVTLNRRSLIRIAICGLALCVGAASAQTTSPGARFINETSRRLVEIVNGPGTIESKKPRMADIIDSAVDVDGVARFCLGRFWTIATPAQRDQYTRLFHSVLVNNITGKLGEYQGVRITVGRSMPREDAEQVDSVVDRPNNPPANVAWLVSSGMPKIIDVIAEGTSLRLTQRQDYMSYLAHNNSDIDKLIAAMREQASRNG